MVHDTLSSLVFAWPSSILSFLFSNIILAKPSSEVDARKRQKLPYTFGAFHNPIPWILLNSTLLTTTLIIWWVSLAFYLYLYVASYPVILFIYVYMHAYIHIYNIFISYIFWEKVYIGDFMFSYFIKSYPTYIIFWDFLFHSILKLIWIFACAMVFPLWILCVSLHEHITIHSSINAYLGYFWVLINVNML